MVRYNLPSGMRYSSLGERESFYKDEFDLIKVGEWLQKRGHIEGLVFAVVIGRHTKIFPKRYKDDASTTIIIDEYENLEDVKSTILNFTPESVYYDRNVYTKNHKIIGQELAFDLDPENVECPIHGTLENKMNQGQGLSFCEIELKMVKEETIKLYEELLSTFSLLEIIYSGRGFHIHVLDEDSLSWSYSKRKKFANKIRNRGYLIDVWVTSGSMRLIRLPFSLHAMVSRVVTPLTISELESFNPLENERCTPNFLKQNY